MLTSKQRSKLKALAANVLVGRGVAVFKLFYLFPRLLYYQRRNNAYSLRRGVGFQLRLNREKGVISRLREMGVKEKDTVIVGDVEFDFIN